MSKRTTLKDLENIISRINSMTGSPPETWTKVDGKLRSNVGNYHLNGAYGGWRLDRIVNESGAVDDVLQVGYVSKPELKRLLFAFINGLGVHNE